MANDHYEGAGSGSYGPLRSDQSYEYDSGIVALPLAGATPAHRLIRLHGGFGRRTVSWSASRAGKPPIVPSMANTQGDVFLGGSMETALPVPNPQVGGYNWSVSGVYTFVQTTPRKAGTDTFSAGAYPYPMSPTDQLAQQCTTPEAIAATIAATPASAKTNAFGLAVSPDKEEHRNDTYLWPFTLLPPVFTNDYLIGG